VIQNILGILVGSLITLLVLIISNANTREQYVTALVIGGICNGLWPIVAGIWLARRAKARREEKMQEEVTRQVNEQTKGK
jgi:cadmium resistance protein CadD (predicted permease)